MYRDIQITVREKDPIHAYLNRVSLCANNLYNAALFRVRQVLTGLKKEPDKITEYEQKVLNEIREALPKMKSKFKMPTKEKTYLSYAFLDALMHATENPDYYAEGFPAQCAQQMLKLVQQNMDSFYAQIRDYNQFPEKYKARPKLPKYHKKQSCCTFVFTNQCVQMRKAEELNDAVPGVSSLAAKMNRGMYFVFPKTRLVLPVGDALPAGGRLKECKVCPYHGAFILHFIFDCPDSETPLKTAEPKRICAIDLGITNFAAISNNIGLPGLLLKAES